MWKIPILENVEIVDVVEIVERHNKFCAKCCCS